MTTPRSFREDERKRKEQHWQHHLVAWKRSGLTQAEYCRGNQLSSKCFTYWKRRIERPDAPVRRQTDLSMKLIPVPVSPVREHKPATELAFVLGDRYRVEVGDGFNPETFEKLVRVLAQI